MTTIDKLLNCIYYYFFPFFLLFHSKTYFNNTCINKKIPTGDSKLHEQNQFNKMP